MVTVAEPADQHDMIFASVACANLRSRSPCKALDRLRKIMVDTDFVGVLRFSYDFSGYLHLQIRILRYHWKQHRPAAVSYV